MKKTEIQVIERKNDLTSLQWRIYDWLSEIKRVVSTKEIYNQFKLFYPLWDGKVTWNNAQARRMISDDITAIRSSDCILAILKDTPSGIGFVSEEETDNYIKSREISLSKEWNILQKDKKRRKLDQQMRLTFGREKPVIEAYKAEENG